MKLSTEQIETYHQTGALVVPSVFPSELIDQAIHAHEQIIRRFSAECGIPYQEYNAVISQVRDLWKHESTFEQLILNSALASIASQLMDRPAARLLHDHLISKPIETSGEVPWHQDYPYWPIDHNFGLSCWLAMDDVEPQSGALEFIPGSHLLGEEPPVDFLQDLRQEFHDHPDKVILPVNRGDVVVLHSLTWHRTGANTSLPQRRAYISLWIPPESRYSPLHADWHPVNYHIDVDSGELLNTNWFPVVGKITDTELASYSAGSPKVQDHKKSNEQLSMFNASVTIRKRLQELLLLVKENDSVRIDDVFEYLIDTKKREFFVKLLTNQGIVSKPSEASKCLQDLSINSIAWQKHHARNVCNQGYVAFQELFGS